MNNRRILRWMSAGFLVSGLSACSTIQGWFPDKERDYQFTSEIPDLVVPDDLKNKGLASLSPASVAPAEAEPESRGQAETVQETTQAKEAAAEQPDWRKAETKAQEPETEATPVAEVGPTENVSSLQIDQAKTPATRMVGRALSRKQLEIVERNIDKGYFYVKFDPDAVEAKDDSIWDEFTFLFGDDPSQEQEYRITVRQVNEQLSNVTVQDSEGKNLSNAVANALLKLITDGINEVVKQDAGPDAPKETGEQKTLQAPADKE